MKFEPGTFLSRKALPRRTFLRGVGATLALPLLDAMTPAFAAERRRGRRASVSSTPATASSTKPSSCPAPARRSSFRPCSSRSRRCAHYLTVVSGLDHAQANNFGDGTGDHPRSSAAWLTGVHAYDRTRPASRSSSRRRPTSSRPTCSGAHTPVRSLELAVDTATQSACDSGDCFYVNTVSWRNETTPNLTENHPRVVFERLFGDGGTRRRAHWCARRRRRAFSTPCAPRRIASQRRSATAIAASCREYLDSVREIEQRIGAAETESHGDVELPERPLGIPASFDDYAKLMLDLQLLAFQTDTTRVFSMILAREVSNRPYPHIGVPDQHHAASHHRDDAGLIEKKTKIDAYHVSLLGLSRREDADDAPTATARCSIRACSCTAAAWATATCISTRTCPACCSASSAAA